MTNTRVAASTPSGRGPRLDIARGVNRPVVLSVRRLVDAYPAVARQQGAVAAEARGEARVVSVDA